MNQKYFYLLTENCCQGVIRLCVTAQVTHEDWPRIGRLGSLKMHGLMFIDNSAQPAQSLFVGVVRDPITLVLVLVYSVYQIM